MQNWLTTYTAADDSRGLANKLRGSGLALEKVRMFTSVDRAAGKETATVGTLQVINIEQNYGKIIDYMRIVHEKMFK